MYRRPAHFASLDDVRVSLSTNRNFDTANHLFRALGGEANCILQRRASVEVASGEIAALSLLRVAVSDIDAGQKISADHLQAITPRFVGSQH
jgi:hypothetical protein